MSVNVPLCAVRISAKGGKRMKKQKDLTGSMTKLLAEAADETGLELLRELGIGAKGATKYTVVAAALYKKAAAGDMSAIKEIRSLMTAPSQVSGEVVNIIDDTDS